MPVLRTVYEFIYRIRHHYGFSREELYTMILTALTFGLAVSFREWGEKYFNVNFGVFNFINATLICFLSIIVHESAHKLYALKRGYRAESRNWRIGLAITLFLAFFTNGYFPFLAFGGIIIHHVVFERLGSFRYRTNLWEHAIISAAGPMASITLALFFKILIPINPLAEKAMIINILICLMNLIPLPFLDGGDIFYASRLLWAFLIGFCGSVSFLIYYTGLIYYAVILAAAFGILGWFLFGVLVDKTLFQLR